MIERHGLFADAPGMPLEERIIAARSSIRFESISSAAGSGLSAIVVAARGTRQPRNAARIANDLAQNILDMGAEGRRRVASANYTFSRRKRRDCGHR